MLMNPWLCFVVHPNEFYDNPTKLNDELEYLYAFTLHDILTERIIVLTAISIDCSNILFLHIIQWKYDTCFPTHLSQSEFGNYRPVIIVLVCKISYIPRVTVILFISQTDRKKCP
jgi:hypothetical protein